MDPIKIALIIIFNHRYDQNIKVLEAIYKYRFSHLYFLVPFYDGNQPNVIPVYENSYYYQGYIAQAFQFYFKEEYGYYLFIADDMILNPLVNENNLIHHLKLNEFSCFIPNLVSLHDVQDRWHTQVAIDFNVKEWGVEAVNEIPSYEEALTAFNKFNLKVLPLRHSQIYESESILRKMVSLVKICLRRKKIPKKHYQLPYPLVGAFSDFIVIPKRTIKKFAHYCGVFAAMNLFVELAIPTAMVLSTDEIVTEKDLPLHGQYLWSEQELRQLDEYNQSLSNLIKNFPVEWLFIHPVKLSKWDTEILQATET